MERINAPIPAYIANVFPIGPGPVLPDGSPITVCVGDLEWASPVVFESVEHYRLFNLQAQADRFLAQRICNAIEEIVAGRCKEEIRVAMDLATGWLIEADEAGRRA